MSLPPITSLEHLPVVLRLGEVARIQGTTVTAIYDRLHRGSMLPQPIAKHPYRWAKADLEKWLRGEYREQEDRIRERQAARRRKARSEKAA